MRGADTSSEFQRPPGLGPETGTVPRFSTTATPQSWETIFRTKILRGFICSLAKLPVIRPRRHSVNSRSALRFSVFNSSRSWAGEHLEKSTLPVRGIWPIGPSYSRFHPISTRRGRSLPSCSTPTLFRFTRFTESIRFRLCACHISEPPRLSISMRT